MENYEMMQHVIILTIILMGNDEMTTVVRGFILPFWEIQGDPESAPGRRIRGRMQRGQGGCITISL